MRYKFRLQIRRHNLDTNLTQNDVIIAVFSCFLAASKANAAIQELKKGLQVFEIACKPLIYIGRYKQTRTADLYDVKVISIIINQ